MKGLTRRGVQVSLGAFWIVDGLLQLQPKMFTSAFANKVITPVAVGQPDFVSSPIRLGLNILHYSPVFFDVSFALIQLIIGCLILNRKSVKTGLIFSAFWGIVVWALGEGYGGIFSGHALLLMGAPGAALIYVILSLAVLPARKDAVAGSSPAYWLVIFWAIIWIGGGIFQLLPGQNTSGELSSMLYANSVQAPAWLSSLDQTSGNFIGSLKGSKNNPRNNTIMVMGNHNLNTVNSSNPGYIFVLFLSLLQITIGLTVFWTKWLKAVITVGIILSLIFWLIGQDLGNLYSGLATDPGTGPLITLLGLAVISVQDLRFKLSLLGTKLEKLMSGNMRSV